MRIRSVRTARTRGNTLAATLCITVVIGIALACYLDLVSNQNLLVARSQVWNSAMPVLEAGIEEALTQLTYNYGTNMISNGWSNSGTNYWKTNSLDPAYWVVSISTNLSYIITSTGYYPMPGSSTYVSRSVQVKTQNKGVFSGGLLVRNTVDLNGNNIMTDSYDSSDPAKSTGGKYDPAKAGDKGDVACTGGISDSLKIGNANVWGHLYTGPSAVVNIGPNGSIGDVAWQKAGTTGIKPGWWQNDFNVDYPDVRAPFVAAVPPLPGLVGGTLYTYVLGNGNYLSPTLGNKVIVTGNAVLYVTGDIKFTGSDSLEIQPGASLTIYAGGASSQLTAIVNSNTTARSFVYLGLPSNTSLSISGNAALTCAIYAPEADISLKGGTQVYGSIVARSAVMTGISGFHYDESLVNALPSRGFIITAWNEF